MSSWRERILSEFTPGAARLTLVADPDGLLLEEGVLAAIRERGFEPIAFDDPVAFRYAYESGFRSRWDRGEGEGPAVVLRSGAARSAVMTDLFDSPSLFPFRMPRLSAARAAALSPRLNILQRGLDGDLLMLRESSGRPATGCKHER